MTSEDHGTASRRTTRLSAGSTLPLMPIKQSVNSTPLLTEVKAKLLALNSQLILAGTDTLVLPTLLVYCSHSVSA